jgi:hypothetical protein
MIIIAPALKSTHDPVNWVVGLLSANHRRRVIEYWERDRLNKEGHRDARSPRVANFCFRRERGRISLQRDQIVQDSFAG